MSLFLLVIGLVFYYCNAAKKALAFSGGGIRAAAGTYYAMRRFEEIGALDTIDSISLISGGSWGFIMWLYEDHPDDVVKNIYEWMYENEAWGTKGPIEKETFSSKSWYEKWREEIKTHVIDMTSLKGEELPKFNEDFRVRLRAKHLEEVKVYFVVEKFKPRAKSFEDYCWFKSSPDGGDEFTCSNGIHHYPIENTRVVRETDVESAAAGDTYDEVYLLDVLNYCSSAWATKGGQASITKVVTKEFRVSETKEFDKIGAYAAYRLIDAGDEFNDALMPYMVDDYYISQSTKLNVEEIQNFDFSEPSTAELKHRKNLFEIGKLPKQMHTIDREKYELFPPLECQSKTDGEYHDVRKFWIKTGGIMGTGKKKKKESPLPIQPSYKCHILDRFIHHIPLWGEYSRNKFITYFPTMKSGPKKMITSKWNIMSFMFFEKDWNGHLKTILKGTASDMLSSSLIFDKKKDRTSDMLSLGEGPMSSYGLATSGTSGALHGSAAGVAVAKPMRKAKLTALPPLTKPKTKIKPKPRTKTKTKPLPHRRKLLIEPKAFNRQKHHTLTYSRQWSLIVSGIMIILLMMVSFALVYNFHSSAKSHQNIEGNQLEQLNEPQTNLNKLKIHTMPTSQHIHV